MNLRELHQKQASENRVFSLILPLGSKKRKDLAVEFAFGGEEGNTYLLVNQT